MSRYTLYWRESAYRIDQRTLLFWPEACILCTPDTSPTVRLIAARKHLIKVAIEDEFLEPEEHAEERSEQKLLALALEAYATKGYQNWSVQEAMVVIGESPDSELAAALVECLEYWFFIEKRPLVSPPPSE